MTWGVVRWVCSVLPQSKRELLKQILSEVRNMAGKIDDFNAELQQVGVDIGKHLDDLDGSITVEINTARTQITDSLTVTGATDAQIQAANDALRALDTAVSSRIDTTKSRVDAAFVDAAFPASAPAAPAAS